jgi:hypothetical protein
MGVGGQRHAPAALPPGKTRYPLYRRLGGLQGRSGRVLKICPPPTGIRSPDRPRRCELLYWLRYPGPQSSPKTSYKRYAVCEQQKNWLQDSQLAYVQLVVPGARCGIVLLKPLQSPYSQFSQLFYQSCTTFCNTTPLHAIFPNGPCDDRARSQFFWNRITNIHTVRYTGGYFSNSHSSQAITTAATFYV